MERLTDTLKILRLAKKRKRVTIREADYWVCENLVKQQLLNKNFPPQQRSHGWPEYKISKKGKMLLDNFKPVSFHPNKISS